MTDGTLCQSNWFGRHKFEARYDLSPADISSLDNISGMGAAKFIENLRAKTYVHDICVRCGKIIKRGQ